MNWIKINEKLPELHKKVLLTDGKNYSIDAFGSDSLTDWQYNNHWNTIPTHWIYLPLPPNVYDET